MKNLLAEIDLCRHHFFINKDFLQRLQFLEAVLAAFDLEEEWFAEEGDGIGDNVDEFGLSWIRGGVPILFMISQAD